MVEVGWVLVSCNSAYEGISIGKDKNNNYTILFLIRKEKILRETVRVVVYENKF